VNTKRPYVRSRREGTGYTLSVPLVAGCAIFATRLRLVHLSTI
jgi:hypothetical protein